MYNKQWHDRKTSAANKELPGCAIWSFLVCEGTICVGCTVYYFYWNVFLDLLVLYFLCEKQKLSWLVWQDLLWNNQMTAGIIWAPSGENGETKGKRDFGLNKHILAKEFSLMPSGRRYLTPLRRTNKCANSFISSAIRLLKVKSSSE